MPVGFPIGTETAPEHSGALPDHADLVVIGGGVIGIMTAWFAARRGMSVLVLEKGRVAAEQSSRNWGWIRAQGRDPAELPIMVEAAEHWRELARQTNEDIGLRQSGVCYLANSPKEMARFEAWLPHAMAHGLDSRLLNGAEVAALMPGAALRYEGALWTAGDMRAEPWVAVPALARIASRAGVTIREGCAVRTLDLEAGRVTGVVTEAGRVSAPRVVLAGGAWSALFLRNHGVSIPQLSVKATVAATEALPAVFEGGAVDDRLAWRRRADGGYTLAPEGFHEMFVGPDAFRAFGRYTRAILSDPLGTKYLPAAPKGYPDAWGTPRRWQADEVSPFERMRVLNPNPNRARVEKLSLDFAATFPGAGEVKISQSWAGMIDTLPDVVPVIDEVAPLPGLIVATGMCGHGFGIGPGVGRVVASLAAGEEPGHDLSRFRLSRFSDGSKMVLGPNL